MSEARPPDVDVMAFGTHPDDIELGCAGTLIKLCDMGRSVVLVDATHGELSTRGTPQTRQAEAAAAAQIIGALARENLGLPDGNVCTDLPSKRAVARAIRKYRPHMILLPYYQDRHPDHVHASEVIYDGAFMAGLARVEIEGGDPAYRPRQMVYYMDWYEFEPTFIVDITAQFERKMQAIYAYTTQFKADGEAWPQTRLTLPEHDRLRRARMAYYGSLIGQPYGEGFLIRGRLEAESPLALQFSSF